MFPVVANLLIRIKNLPLTHIKEALRALCSYQQSHFLSVIEGLQGAPEH